MSSSRDLLTRRALFSLGAARILRPATPPLPLELFFRLFDEDTRSANEAMKAVGSSWTNGYAAMVLEMARIFLTVASAGQTAPLPSAEAVQTRAMRFLADRTGKDFGPDLRAWNQWVWSLAYAPHPQYGEFKGLVYALIDRRMRDFFPAGVDSKIRLDQVEWGGVGVNGIPPLVNPKMIPAGEAAFLKDSHVVFGIEAGGEAKAYPKRILAWHEMAIDRVGDLDLTIVYCTLCGTVIPYLSSSVAAGRKFTFGTSGLLYQSSKLMFDVETKSLWPTLQGKPMIGPLAGSGLELEFAPVVTTTWAEWRTRHPRTLVASLDTGHKRDYGEGVAYRDYFATQDLMFEVSRRDRRLKNKDEILAIRLPGKTPLAISARFLEKRPEFDYTHEGVRLTIRTDKTGANRVYAADGKQLPAYRAFWFGWYAQYPDTALVK